MARRKRNRKHGKGNRRRDDRGGADPVVGYFAYRGMDVVCDGDACIITGTTHALHKAIDWCDPEGAASYSIRRTTANEVLSGMAIGGTYALDELAYQRFLPPAQKMGLPIGPEDFSEPGPNGMHLAYLEPFVPIGSPLLAAASW